MKLNAIARLQSLLDNTVSPSQATSSRKAEVQPEPSVVQPDPVTTPPAEDEHPDLISEEDLEGDDLYKKMVMVTDDVVNDGPDPSVTASDILKQKQNVVSSTSTDLSLDDRIARMIASPEKPSSPQPSTANDQVRSLTQFHSVGSEIYDQ